MLALATISFSSITRVGASRPTTPKLRARNGLLLRTVSRRRRPILLIFTNQGEEFRWLRCGLRLVFARHCRWRQDQRREAQNLSRIMTKRQLDDANAVLIAESCKPQRRATPATAAFALLSKTIDLPAYQRRRS